MISLPSYAQDWLLNTGTGIKIPPEDTASGGIWGNLERRFLEFGFVAANGHIDAFLLAGLCELIQRHLILRGMADDTGAIDTAAFAGHAFAPQNAVEAVRQTPKVELLPDCRESAVAELIRRLDGVFPRNAE